MKTVKKCPECESKNITFSTGLQLGMIYQCKECGYRGPLIIEEDIE
ncbi:MAG: hypothetical protein KKB03_03550 [Nanoarchaeota archaeon]|nr:hypothetical protein [Nanoarchaeota archaeon]MBU1135057.1 hypothetical protein [Nanoarchaeota archaeon]MBU2520288.1 hypothetical protein [Nanoarchaeota archaeon]